MAEQKMPSTKKEAKSMLIARNSVMENQEMTPREAAVYMCDHLEENGKSALVPYKENGQIVPNKYLCKYCRESFSILPIQAVTLANSIQVVTDTIQQVKMLTPLSDATAYGLATFMHLLKKLPGNYRNATKDANTTNQAFNYMKGGKQSQLSSFYNRYGNARGARAPK